MFAWATRWSYRGNRVGGNRVKDRLKEAELKELHPESKVQESTEVQESNESNHNAKLKFVPDPGPSPTPSPGNITVFSMQGRHGVPADVDYVTLVDWIDSGGRVGDYFELSEGERLRVVDRSGDFGYGDCDSGDQTTTASLNAKYVGGPKEKKNQ